MTAKARAISIIITCLPLATVLKTIAPLLPISARSFLLQTLFLRQGCRCKSVIPPVIPLPKLALLDHKDSLTTSALPASIRASHLHQPSLQLVHSPPV